MLQCLFKSASKSVCCVLRRTVFDGISEEQQVHGHYTRCHVVVLQLGFHELLESLHILQVFIHTKLTQEIT